MDLDFGSEPECFCEDVREFRSDHGPLRGAEADLPRREAAALFRFHLRVGNVRGHAAVAG